MIGPRSPNYSQPLIRSNRLALVQFGSIGPRSLNRLALVRPKIAYKGIERDFSDERALGLVTACEVSWSADPPISCIRRPLTHITVIAYAIGLFDDYNVTLCQLLPITDH
jgi:hypothetical protein